VGVNIEMTPTVHFDHDVTLKIKIEDSSENGTETISGVTEPIIAQKTSEQVIRLREGEASVMSGILNRQEIESWSGVPGLSSIPGVKYLFGNKDHTITDDEIVFLIIPHIVRSQDISPTNLRPIDTGVGTSIDLRHTSAQETSQPTGQSPDSVPAKTPGRPNNHSQFGSVPGASVDAAAPAALAQMRAAADTAPSLPASQPAMEKIPVVTIPATPLPAATVPLSLSFRPPATPVAAGSAFQIPILLNGGVDVAAVPMQITYDPALLSLVNVAGGDLLSRDGQALAVVHRDEGPGTITLNVSRPPGAKGISGSGVVCLLSFQAKKPGAATLVITRPTALNSAQQPLAATGGRIQLQVK